MLAGWLAGCLPGIDELGMVLCAWRKVFGGIDGLLAVGVAAPTAV